MSDKPRKTGREAARELAELQPSNGRTRMAKKVKTVRKEKEEKEGFFGKLKEIAYGMSAHDMSRYALRTRASMEHLFILITMGDLIGVPILPPYYSLRLLPYVVPNISTWKRRMLREKDVSDAMF